MQSYTLYNDDVACANFVYANGLIREYRPTMPALLPMQIRSCGAEAFMLWLDTRSIDLNVFQHRNMVKQLLGSRDKLTLALRTNMFSIHSPGASRHPQRFHRRELHKNMEA